MAKQAFWAVTSYFNPAGWQRRRHNYDIFRSNLSIPLLTVEFASGGQFELGPEDADILIQISGGDVMWQKERLLNLGINALPDSAEYVAWLDCDIVFEDDDWWQKAMQKLEQAKVLQPFSQVVHLTAKASGTFSRELTHHLENILYDNEWPVARLLETGGDIWLGRDLAWLSGEQRPTASAGLAWVSRRDTLQQIGLYDRFILGSGDRVAVAGYLGDFPGFAKTLAHGLTQSTQTDCLAWAQATFEHVNGYVDYLPGRLFDLWHGDIRNRHYDARHAILKTHDFDPARDIERSTGGAWKWASHKPEMHAAVQRYFAARREDG